MTAHEIIEKIWRRLWGKLVRFTYQKKINHLIYFSYWHYLLHKNPPHSENPNAYFSARPNPGAGIGHQISNWIGGYWFANYFDLQFAHIPFSNGKWEHFLGFGADEVLAKALLKGNYTKVRVPFFDENKPKEVELIRKIINSYAGQNVVFLAEQDQFFKDQYLLRRDLQQKFYKAVARVNEKLIYAKNHCNIAIHVRRGDIYVENSKNPNLTMRWQSNDYFVNVLSNTLNKIKTKKLVNIFLFSQGSEKDFMEFEVFENVKYCLDMSVMDSFLHMVYADILITSKSSFSYKPALLSKGIKICPDNFWHGYPSEDDWIIADEHGNFNITEINLND